MVHVNIFICLFSLDGTFPVALCEGDWNVHISDLMHSLIVQSTCGVFVWCCYRL